MKTFPLQLDDDLHKCVKIASTQLDKTIHEWILTAIKYELKNEGYWTAEKEYKYGNGNKKSKA